MKKHQQEELAKSPSEELSSLDQQLNSMSQHFGQNGGKNSF
jgi:hypothetical protein